MGKEKTLVFNCEPGMILAEDIICNGSKLASKNTVINSYIIEKLISLGEYSVCIYGQENETDLSKNNNSTVECFRKDYYGNISKIKKIIGKLTSEDKITFNEVLEVSESIITYIEEPSAIIECLNSLKRADEYTYSHSINVAIYAMLIAKWMKIPANSIKEIIQAGILHDIGKIKIDNEILNKPGKLTNDEFYEMKKHTIFGYDLINNYNDFNENIKSAILMHHERIDGSGYPFGKTGYNITLNARIISVADTFDAMTSNRVYKKGTTPFKAFIMFMSEGMRQYDTSVIFALLENISAYYIGMKAEIGDGRIGEIVYIPPNDISSPIIKVDNELIDFSERLELEIIRVFV